MDVKINADQGKGHQVNYFTEFHSHFITST